MLTQLTLHHFAIVDDLTLTFGPNFSVITGETGAGKSIIIDALAILLGKSVGSDWIKSGHESGWIEATFVINDVSQFPDLAPYLDPDSPTYFTVFRQRYREKGNIARINGQRVPLKILKGVMPQLIYIVGQHHTTQILDTQFQRQLIDEYGNITNTTEFKQYQDAYQEYIELKSKLEDSPSGIPQLIQEREFIRFQLDDLTPHAFTFDEENTLKAVKHRFKTNKQALSALSQFQSSLTQSYELLSETTRSMSRIDITIPPDVLSHIESAIASIDPPLSWSQQLSQQYESDAMYNIDEIESRLDLIFRYKTKYHVSHLHELVSKISELKNREAALSELIDSSDSLKAKLSEYRQACIGYAEAIHLRRTEAATMLAKHLETDCLNLHFSYCKLNFNCTFSPDSLNAWGADQFDLNISTNKGIPIGPLKTVASGGELSRLMLAIETYRSHSKRPGTLIFDEIDTGIGGITAHAIGEYLSRISKNQPLICITHLAQIAGLANTHLFIEKFETSNSTSIKARHLNTNEKKYELNRMIGGDLVAINL